MSTPKLPKTWGQLLPTCKQPLQVQPTIKKPLIVQPKRKARVRAVSAAAPVYFAKPSELSLGYVVRSKLYRGDIPVFILPADAESVNAMIIECGNAIYHDRENTGSNHQTQARAALAAIGIRAPKKGGRR